MNILFFAFIFFFFLIIQTCILSYSSGLFLCFALELVPVLLVSIRYHRHTACFCVALAGLFMDSLSGCAFFTHMFSYIWIYIMIQFFKRLVFLKNFFFILIVTVLSICIELGMMLFPVLVAQGQVPDGDLLYVKQAVIAMITVPPMVWMVDALRKYWLDFVQTMQEKWIRFYRD